MADRQCLVAAGYMRDGKLRLAHQDAFKATLARWHNCRLLIRIEEHLDPLSEALRAYYFAGILGEICNETGYSDREAHLLIKELCMPYSQAAMRGNGRIVGDRVLDSSIANITNREALQLHDNIRLWAIETLDGLIIPDPPAPDVVAA